MESKVCMNEACRGKSSSEWKKGWTLKSGESSTLCYNCGSVYENSVFCETFHLKETGWRECKFCGKRIHCGCIASKHLHEYLDFGGVGCITCVNFSECYSMRSAPVQIPGSEVPNGISSEDVQPTNTKYDEARLMQMTNSIDANGGRKRSLDHKDKMKAPFRQMSGEEIMLPQGRANACYPNFPQRFSASSMFLEPKDNGNPSEGYKDANAPVAQPGLNFSLNAPPNAPRINLSFVGGNVEGSQQNRAVSPPQGEKAWHTSSELTKHGSGSGSEVNKRARIARPPAERRVCSQVLPRYWPRITDKELQEISGNFNSTVVPLFEKTLSASDAGRVGRLVLPKACAEAYFPMLNQSDGLPLRIQDAKGKEWTFQFRFWPNNNSRMYVLEGVTPCIRNMQLQAGDTVTFSRIEPSGQLVMGFRKAMNNADPQDQQAPVLPNGGSAGEDLFLGLGINRTTKIGFQTSKDSLQLHFVTPKKKRARNIGPKNKRVVMHSVDAMELRVTLAEAQDLMRPPPAAKPTIILVEDYEFEEYNEPPLFGKKSIFTVRPSGEQAQWAQCDTCKQWRKLPVDVILPAKWTCANNIWDLNKCSCLVPEEMITGYVDVSKQARRDFKRQRMTDNRTAKSCIPSALDALATAAFSGDCSDGPTTKHPRHRTGCTCIVCVQPPSGKGKHPSTCKCPVCNTAKRRYNTLMVRKKREQSKREAEICLGKGKEENTKSEAEMEGAAELAFSRMNRLDDKTTQNGNAMDIAGCSRGQFDLNCYPSREDDMLAEATAGLDMATLMNAASQPLERYLEQNGLANLNHGLLSYDAECDAPLADEADAVAKVDEKD